MKHIRVIILIVVLVHFGVKCVHAQAPGLYINEVSQGPTGSKEYVELIVVGSPTCFAIPTLDLRGWYIDDNNGFHAAGAGTGIAVGCVRFTQDPLWAAVPIGTLIVIHNDADPNASVPATDLSLSDGNCLLVIPVSNCALLEKHTTLPSTIVSTYPTSGFSACGNWTNISMANSDDSFQTISPAGTLFHAVSWGNNTASPIIYFAGSSAGMVALMTNATNNNITTQANWSRVAVAGNESPGSPNNAANQAWICSMNNGCTPPGPITATSTQVNAVCTCNGSATVTASGGFGGCGNLYTYAWTPVGGTSATASSLCAGTYTCTITDVNGCTGTRTVTITSSAAFTLSSAQTNVTCNGASTGSATVTPTGGTAPFTYAWSPSGGTGSSATGLAAGTYTVTVVDAASCSATIAITITQPPAITLTPTQTNVLCNGGATGSASVAATGGTGTYTYSWAPSGGTGSSATGLTAQTYTVTVSSPAGCTATQVFSITAPPALASTGTQTNILCNAACTGAASVTVTGGVGPYTYLWAPSGGTAAGTTGRCVGTYTVTFTDTNGCTGTRSFTITQPTALTATTSFTQATCNMSNGSAAVNVTGGVGPYTYLWAPLGGTTATVTGRPAGIYTVTYTDANGCTGTATVNISNAAAPTATITATVNVTCFGASTGGATVAASGGVGPYTYLWAPSGGTGSSTTGRPAGTYTVTITDVNGCTVQATVTITQPPAITLTPTQTNVLCNGGATGSASVAATGGTGTYTYSWAPSGGTGSSATGLTAQTYTVTVSSPAGCTATQIYTITAPPALTSTGTQTNILCNAACTGVASVTVSGGVGPYTYLWAPSGGTGSSATALCVGSYTVTFTDANGCTGTRAFTITQPTALAATTSFTQATCNMSNGSASVSVSGGVGPYTYLWAPLGGTTATVTGRPAGTYTVTYTDANGCTGTATVNISNAAAPTATITATVNVTCFGGNNGSATVAASGGTGPYTYAWSPIGGTGATGTNLTAQSYTVAVSDVNGCTTSATVTITQPPALTASATSSPVLCNGGSTGSATVTASGGVGPYTYAWAPTGGTSASASGLNANTYTCIVTDANGCTTTTSVSITQPSAIVVSASFTSVSCFGGNDGTATTTASGGAGGYSYAWSPTGGSAALATGLIAQAYTCLVTDINGCTATASVTITQPPVLSATMSFTQATCGNANGSASITAIGGTPAYSYLWSPSGGTGATETGLLAGAYTCVVTDSKGCTLTVTVNVTNSNSPVVTIGVPVMISCFGGSNGSASASSTGGIAPYVYLWSNADPDSIAGTLVAGTYTVTVTDANGCSDTSAVTITEPPVLTSILTATNVICNGGASGIATATATGGVAPYTYLWTPSAQTTQTATALTAQAYTCLITDVNGCTSTASVTVTEPTALNATASMNPVLCNGGNTGDATVAANGGIGPYTYLWTPTGQTTVTAVALAAQPYSVVVTDANGCTINASTTVTEPTALAATTSFTQATCNSANGSADVLVTGGTAAYTYAWSPTGGTAAIATGLTAGTYTCFITDANGCTLTTSVAVPNANSPVASIGIPTNVTCFGGTNGSATATSSGGTGPYTYLWSNSDTDSIAANLGAGSYTVTIADASGCTSTTTVLITQPTQLSVQAGANPSSVCAGSAVLLTASAGGGTPAYQYVWTPGPLIGATQSITPTTTQTYVAIVTDANGCTTSSPVVVTVNPVPVAVFVADDTSGCAPICVNFSDLSTVASGTITGWSWDFGDNTASTQQNPSHCYTTPGIFTVVLTVTTNSGCTQSVTMANYINVFSVPVAGFTYSPQPVTMLNPVVSFTDTSIGAASWLWSFGDVLQSSSTLQNPTFEYIDGTCHQIVLAISSSDGCTDTAVQEICVDPEVTLYVPNTFTPDGDGDNEFFLPIGTGIDWTTLHMMIFDRWGNLIYETDDINDPWDGKVQGHNELVQIDTYVWKIEVKDIKANQHYLIGHVNVIR